MANTKISALTAATTPVVGTETLPIVQSGVTKQVSIANLTAGRAVSAGSLSLTTALTTGNGGTGLTSFTAQGVLYASSTSALATGTGVTYDGSLGVGYGINPSVIGSRLVLGNYSDTSATLNSAYIASNKAILSLTADGATNGNGATISVGWANGGQGPLKLAIGATTALQVEADQNVTFKTQNLVQGTAAKGINFTANTGAAGKTSQLLNWYEEGTWTPTDSSGAGLTLTVANAVYTRVGRLVTVSAVITYPATASALAMEMSGLPFTAGQPASGTALTNSNQTNIALVNTSNTYVRLYTVPNAAFTRPTNADFSGKSIYLNITYPV